MLRAHDVHALYGKSHVLRGVTLEVGRGEVVALLGRNGAGKSTTLKVLMGLATVSGGRIALGDGAGPRDITHLPPYGRAALGIGYVPEDRRIFPALTVVENLRIGLDRTVRAPAARREALDRIFALFPALGEKRGALGQFLSGGQQQMLALARVLIMRPQIVLLDEPSQGLSPMLVQSMLERVVQLAREGIGILLVEQNALLALDVSRRAYIMDKGTVRYDGDAQALRRDPQTLQRLMGVS
ncbi:MAG: ABC transporter ATP-binding protein [Armatimonadota bacterium]